MCTFYIAAPEDCEWSAWEIGTCSQTCGMGTRIKTRTKTQDESPGGVCFGDTKMEEDCNIQECPGRLPYMIILNYYRFLYKVLQYLCDVSIIYYI